MRVSGKKDSPYYIGQPPYPTILFNGEPVPKVIEACEEEGWILKYVLNEKGHIVPDKTVPGLWPALTETLRGTVRIVFPNEPEGENKG